jgi:outer membrane protein TolC
MNKCSALPRWLSAGLGFLGIVIMCIAVSSPFVGAQQTDKAQDKAKVDSAKQDEGIGELPLSPIEKAQKDGTALALTMKDVTKLALQNNIDIAVSDTNEQMSSLKLKSAWGSYDPKLTVQAGLNDSKSANIYSYQTASDPFQIQKQLSWNASYNQQLRTGATLTASWNTNRTDSNLTQNLFNPQYSAQTSFQITQPLVRNLKIDSSRASITLANLDIKNSDSQFKQSVVTTISNIQGQYWQLVAAIQNYGITRNSVRLARIQLRDNKKKLEVGTLAPIDVTDSEATAAQREVDLFSSEETIQSAENALKQLISNDRKNEIWSKVIVPLDKPDFTEYKVEFNTAMNTALANRPEMEQSDISLKRIDINKRLAENNRKWQVNLSFNYGSSGNNGNYDSFGFPLAAKGLWGAYNSLWTDGYTNWGVQFNIQIPLRTRDLDSQIAQQALSRTQQLMQRKKTELGIQVDITNGIQQLETRRKAVITAGISTKLAQERLDGEEKRFEAGLSQTYLVLDRQQAVAQAELAELNSLINYKQAIINMQKAMYNLLEANDFAIAKGNTSNLPTLK